MRLAKCKYFEPIEKGVKENCANCVRWNGKRCRDEAKLLEEYEESKEFKAFDYMMRQNKGVRLDA
jgi:hypothetical protein